MSADLGSAKGIIKTLNVSDVDFPDPWEEDVPF